MLNSHFLKAFAIFYFAKNKLCKFVENRLSNNGNSKSFQAIMPLKN